MTGHPKKKNRINEQFSVRLISMLESPAYQALSLSGHKVISRIEIELAAHGGNDNGKLPVTYLDFIDYGITRECVAPAIREAEALGFTKITRRGRGGNADYREATLFFLAYAFARNSRQAPPTHDWRKIKTIEEAEQIEGSSRNQEPDGNCTGTKGQQDQTQKQKPMRKTHIGPMRKTRTGTA